MPFNKGHILNKGRKHAPATIEKLSAIHLNRSFGALMRKTDYAVGRYLRTSRLSLYRRICEKLGL